MIGEYFLPLFLYVFLNYAVSEQEEEADGKLIYEECVRTKLSLLRRIQ